MFCKHEWKMLSETVTESKYEHALKAAQSVGSRLTFCNEPCYRKHIQVFTCDKCGKLKRFVEDI